MSTAALVQRAHGFWKANFAGWHDMLHGRNPVRPERWPVCYDGMKTAVHEIERLELEDVLAHAWEVS